MKRENLSSTVDSGLPRYHILRTNDTPFSDGRPTPETNTSTIVCKNVRNMVFVQYAPLHGFGKKLEYRIYYDVIQLYFLSVYFLLHTYHGAKSAIY